MAQYHHHPDGIIFIRTDAGTYFDSIDNFEIDLGAQYPGLPSGFNERRYTPGIEHVLSNGSSAEPQPLAWPEGDAYIAAYDDLVAAKAAREAAA